ncbi:hypothetical protein GcC1_069030 [Golovinomyces cichoracearum]|uniref:Uncharacterized protein n=1 Tax=Golovinomyces cichoracearum TaxID=62708 RepID=A0A420IQG4_9PEZI|nr:hypothetical protein GcC1_069030 [Golovinomyces cichoracearum]
MAGYTYLSEIYTKTESLYRIWPLVDASQSSPTENYRLETYYLFTEKCGLFIESGFQSFPESYKKCETVGNTHRNTVDPISSTTNSEDVEEGHLCDVFFADDYLLRSKKAASGVKDKRSRFPRPFESNESTENSLIWTLLVSRLVFPKDL